MAHELQKINGITMSVRDLSMALGFGTRVANKSIWELQKHGFLKRVFKGKRRNASRYSITDKVFDAAREICCGSVCIEFNHNYIDTIKHLLSHDSFRYKSLNKSGLYILLIYLMNKESSYTFNELVLLSSISRCTISKALKKLIDDDILIEDEKSYSLNIVMISDISHIDMSLEGICIKYNTYGRSLYYHSLYVYERILYRGRKLRYKLEEYGGIPIEEMIILYIFDISPAFKGRGGEC